MKLEGLSSKQVEESRREHGSNALDTDPAGSFVEEDS